MTSFVAAVQDAERAQTIADLKAARAELVTRGRCTGEFVKDDKVCALGAIGVATTEGFAVMERNHQGTVIWCDRRPKRAAAALTKHLKTVGYDAFTDVFLFNDDWDTTDQDVLDLFDKTLADLGGLA